MRRWTPIALIALAVLWFILQNVGSSMALGDFAARPIVALSRDDGTRIPLEQPGQIASDADAAFHHASAILFGHQYVFALPDGTLVSCNHRFRSLSCDLGWTAEREG